MKLFAAALAALFIFSTGAFSAEIEMQPVDSSLIAQIGYDSESEVLAVQMHNSSDVYLYEDVPPSVHSEFLAAESKGRYFVENVKGQYSSSLKD